MLEGLQSEEGKRLSSMLDGYLDTKWGVEVDVAVVVTLGGEDECRQPSTTVSATYTTLWQEREEYVQVGENHVNQSNPLAEYS